MVKLIEYGKKIAAHDIIKENEKNLKNQMNIYCIRSLKFIKGKRVEIKLEIDGKNNTKIEINVSY